MLIWSKYAEVDVSDVWSSFERIYPTWKFNPDQQQLSHEDENEKQL